MQKTTYFLILGVVMCVKMRNIIVKSLLIKEKQMEQLEKNPTCAELVKDKFNEVEQDYNNAQKYFDEFDNSTEGGQIALKVIDKLKGDYFQEYEDLFDYVNNSALSWDYVEAGTFEDQEEGYYRLQLSWGGPSDEFRIYTIADTLEIDVIEYWYMDWFDGAFINVMPDTLSWEVCQMFLDCEVVR